MQYIEDNKENHQNYDILAELQAQDKKTTLRKVSTYIGIKGTEEADKATKKSIDMPGRNNYNKTALYRLLIDHQDGEKLRMAMRVGN